MFFLKIRKMQITITAMIKRPNDFISFINILFHFLIWIAVVVLSTSHGGEWRIVLNTLY